MNWYFNWCGWQTDDDEEGGSGCDADGEYECECEDDHFEFYSCDRTVDDGGLDDDGGGGCDDEFVSQVCLQLPHHQCLTELWVL